MYPYTQKNTAVAPPRGERGLKLRKSARLSRLSGRSPSWGAWIETPILDNGVFRGYGRSPSWGAWIETRRYTQAAPFQTVAPPRGERGLKHFNR